MDLKGDVTVTVFTGEEGSEKEKRKNLKRLMQYGKAAKGTKLQKLREAAQVKMMTFQQGEGDEGAGTWVRPPLSADFQAQLERDATNDALKKMLAVTGGEAYELLDQHLMEQNRAQSRRRRTLMRGRTPLLASSRPSAAWWST